MIPKALSTTFVLLLLFSTQAYAFNVDGYSTNMSVEEAKSLTTSSGKKIISESTFTGQNGVYHRLEVGLRDWGEEGNVTLSFCNERLATVTRSLVPGDTRSTLIKVDEMAKRLGRPTTNVSVDFPKEKSESPSITFTFDVNGERTVLSHMFIPTSPKPLTSLLWSAPSQCD